MINFGKYIGIPYKHKNSDFDGCDCLGLYSLIFREEMNIRLPSYIYTKDFYKKGEDLIIDNVNNAGFVEVCYPYKVFDGLIFFHGSDIVANHIGMWIGNNKFIHVYENTTSMVSKFDEYWKNKLHGGVRYNG